MTQAQLAGEEGTAERDSLPRAPTLWSPGLVTCCPQNLRVSFQNVTGPHVSLSLRLVNIWGFRECGQRNARRSLNTGRTSRRSAWSRVRNSSLSMKCMVCWPQTDFAKVCSPSGFRGSNPNASETNKQNRNKNICPKVTAVHLKVCDTCWRL